MIYKKVITNLNCGHIYQNPLECLITNNLPGFTWKEEPGIQKIYKIHDPEYPWDDAPDLTMLALK